MKKFLFASVFVLLANNQARASSLIAPEVIQSLRQFPQCDVSGGLCSLDVKEDYAVLINGPETVQNICGFELHISGKRILQWGQIARLGEMIDVYFYEAEGQKQQAKYERLENTDGTLSLSYDLRRPVQGVFIGAKPARSFEERLQQLYNPGNAFTLKRYGIVTKAIPCPAPEQ